MADFGKMNLAVAFKPTSAFPLDARCYFTSLAEAQAAAATAEEPGSTNTLYYYGQQLLVYENGLATWYTIQPGGKLVENGTAKDDDDFSVSIFVDDMSVGVDNATVEGEEEDDIALAIE